MPEPTKKETKLLAEIKSDSTKSEPANEGAHPLTARDKRGNLKFHVLVEGNKLKDIEKMYTPDFDINTRSEFKYQWRSPTEYSSLLGASALDVAVQFKRAPIIRWLLAHKADVQQRNGSGNTVWNDALMKGLSSVVPSLLAAKADVNSYDNIGFTALHRCAQTPNPDLARTLIEHKADVNAKLTLITDGPKEATPLGILYYYYPGCWWNNHEKEAAVEFASLLVAAGATVGTFATRLAHISGDEKKEYEHFDSTVRALTKRTA